MNSTKSNNDKKLPDTLLNAIDKNDLVYIIHAMEKVKTDINVPYELPATEDLDLHKPAVETLLHHAFHKNAKDIFPYLLKEGANPKIKNYRNKTVIEEIVEDVLVGSHTSEKCGINYAKQLVEYANIKSRDFLEAVLGSSTFWWDERTDRSGLRQIVDFANNHANQQKIKVGEKQKMLPSTAESEHIRN